MLRYQLHGVIKILLFITHDQSSASGNKTIFNLNHSANSVFYVVRLNSFTYWYMLNLHLRCCCCMPFSTILVVNQRYPGLERSVLASSWQVCPISFQGSKRWGERSSWTGECKSLQWPERSCDRVAHCRLVR